MRTPMGCNLPNRRAFLRAAVATTAACASPSSPVSIAGATEGRGRELAGVIGITTGSLQHQLESGALTALTLPKFVRDELGMQLIDLNTHWLKSFDDSYVQTVREA